MFSALEIPSAGRLQRTFGYGGGQYDVLQYAWHEQP
jgi:hypothetical protein